MSINTSESAASTINLTEIDTDTINLAEILPLLFNSPSMREQAKSDPEPAFELPYDVARNAAYAVLSGGIAYVGTIINRGGIVPIAGLVGAVWFGANAAIDVVNASARYASEKRAWRKRQSARVSK